MDEKMYKELTEFLRQKTEEYNETHDAETKAYLKGEINAINAILYKYDIEALKSERPEIIRCKNCRHDNNCEIQYSAQAGSKFFCGSAERKESEE